jgi:lysophospholipase L1-like esterase
MLMPLVWTRLTSVATAKAVIAVLGLDGVHLSGEQHRQLGRALAPIVRAVSAKRAP